MTGTGQAELSREQFITVMKTEYPQLAKGQGGNMLQLLFDSFDTVRRHALVSYRYAAADVMCLCRGVLQDMSGSIDIEEFSIGIGKLTKGSTSDKLELLFEVYDQDRSGSVTIEELISFVSKATGEYEEARQYTEQVIKRLATNNAQGKGEITESDFAAALRRDPGLYVQYCTYLAWCADSWARCGWGHLRLAPCLQIRLPCHRSVAAFGTCLRSFAWYLMTLTSTVCYAMKQLQKELRVQFKTLQAAQPKFTMTSLLCSWHSYVDEEIAKDSSAIPAEQQVSLIELQRWLAKYCKLDRRTWLGAVRLISNSVGAVNLTWSCSRACPQIPLWWKCSWSTAKTETHR